MDLKTFFEHFDTLAEAPNGIQRLRELILDMAVRGRLVPQDPEDESAEKLIEIINFERNRILKGKKAKASQSSNPPDVKEIYPAPKNWIWAKFGEVTICRDGERIPLSKDLRQSRQGIYDYYGASGVIDKIDDFLFDKPLLLIGEDGANLINRSTPIAFIATGKYWVNNHAHVLDGISYDYLRYLEIFINSIDLKPYITGTAQPKMNQAKMNSISVPLPPLAEQKRIVAKVDELMALCDALKAAQQTRNTLRQNLRASALDGLMNAPSDSELETAWAFVRDNWKLMCDRAEDVEGFRQSILQMAVRGKLLPQNRSDASVEELLKKIESLAEKLTARRNKKSNSLRTQGDKNQFEIPKTWEWVVVGQLAESFTNGLYKPSRYYSDQGTASIRMYNIQDGYLDLAKIKRVLVDENELEAYALEKGDLIVNRVNSRELVGKAALVADIREPFVFEAMNIRVRFLCKETVPEYVNLFFRTRKVRSFFQEVSKQASGQASISQPQVANILIPLPPLAEQKRIIVRVDELMNLCDQLEESLRQQQQQAEALAASAINNLAV
ncbi:MAG: restriction endonuclease subunit S [Tildeniella torsiva UHER 1998/13D]|jgi:type I restriction enzyme S subunit|nr:restriction endonuclease subunit S [Tildeniella torsiva UHER 1998/13D]